MDRANRKHFLSCIFKHILSQQKLNIMVIMKYIYFTLFTNISQNKTVHFFIAKFTSNSVRVLLCLTVHMKMDKNRVRRNGQQNISHKFKNLKVSQEWIDDKSDEVPLKMKRNRNVGGNSESWQKSGCLTSLQGLRAGNNNFDWKNVKVTFPL